jgi:hypothetical protein
VLKKQSTTFTVEIKEDKEIIMRSSFILSLMKAELAIKPNMTMREFSDIVNSL